MKCCRHFSITTFASARERNHSRLRHSSRNLPLKLSPTPFCHGLPGSIVVRGDSLWNIARARYGTGFRHTLIYGANKDQIRDPDLIYPGQVFNLPKIN